MDNPDAGKKLSNKFKLEPKMGRFGVERPIFGVVQTGPELMEFALFFLISQLKVEHEGQGLAQIPSGCRWFLALSDVS